MLNNGRTERRARHAAPLQYCRGFTLLELLAAMTLLVVLGTMLFHVFDQASFVTRVSSGRQEVFQYARTLLSVIGRELSGPIGVRDASIPVATDQGLSRPFRVYHTAAARDAFTGGNNLFASRQGSDVLSFTAGLVGRDTVPGSVTYGQTANCAYVCYWLNPHDNPKKYEPFVLNRYESYDVQSGSMLAGGGGEFALNALEFRIACLDPWVNAPGFVYEDWESASIAPTGGRRGLPIAIEVTLKLTDTGHLSRWQFDPVTSACVLKNGLTPDDDPVVQQFTEIYHLRTRQ